MCLNLFTFRYSTYYHKRQGISISSLLKFYKTAFIFLLQPIIVHYAHYFQGYFHTIQGILKKKKKKKQKNRV